MTTIIVGSVIFAGYVYLCFLQPMLKERKLNNAFQLEARCPACEYTLEESLSCPNCQLDMKCDNSRSISQNMTCPKCSKTFYEKLNYCPHCQDFWPI